MTRFRESVPQGTPSADLCAADARHVQLAKPVDLVLTSPPYPSTYDYLALQHLRRVWFPSDRYPEQEIGSRSDFRDGGKRARRAWRRDTLAWTQRAADNVLPGGHVVIVIGDGRTPSGVVDSSEATESAAKEAGLVSVSRASVEREDHAHKASRWEHVFVFRKPG